MRANFMIVLMILVTFSYGNANAITPGFTVFMNSDFTQTNGIGGFHWEPGSEVTVEIDNGNDGSVDYHATNMLDPDGVVRFYGLFAVQEGDLVKMYDNLDPQNVKEHFVDYLTLSEVDQVTDTLMGAAREGTELYVYVWDDLASLWVLVGQDQADSSENWFVSLTGVFDIVPGSEGFVQTNDGDGDHTQINWLIPLKNTVSIDIKPGSDPNSINPNSQGVISVAILTTDDFDANTVDPLSVEFGPNGAMEAHGKGHIQDADTDGDLDLILHFKTQETGIECGDTEAGLTGETFDGQEIEGVDSINTVWCD